MRVGCSQNGVRSLGLASSFSPEKFQSEASEAFLSSSPGALTVRSFISSFSSPVAAFSLMINLSPARSEVKRERERVLLLLQLVPSGLKLEGSASLSLISIL